MRTESALAHSSTKHCTPGQDARNARLFSTALATLLAAAVLLPLLGHKPLADWDEGIYAEVSREMLRTGWLVPHWNNLPWLEKPPLMLWITAALFKIFGVSEFWARAGSALSGVALVGVLHGWLEHRPDHGNARLTAWLSTFILLTTFGFLRISHVGQTDALLSLGCVIALIGLTKVDEHAESEADHSHNGWYFFWVGLAIAVMAKGAAAIVIPLTALLFAILQRWPLKRLDKSFWLGLALFAFLVLPWHIEMYRLYGHRFLAEYVRFHILSRATRQIEGHITHWWYYLQVLLVLAVPYVLLYPVAIYRLWRRHELRAFSIFAIVVIAFFTAVQTRLPHYIAPAYPALSVITAVYLGRLLQPYIAACRPTSFWIKPAAIVVPLCIASLLLTAPMRLRLHQARLTDGTLVPNNTESILLLRKTFSQSQPIEGPLLLWREGPRRSIATDVFYADRPVQQVKFIPLSPGEETDRYMFNPHSLDEAVTSGLHLILIDKDLIPDIPLDLQYTPIQSAQTVELGEITRPQ